jgi:membrane-bound serine protease (ClpP class)
VITYDGVINPVAAEFISDAIAQAAREKAGALVIRLDTPGGLDPSMRIIVKEMSVSEVPVLVYVAPAGARAASAGVFITLSGHVAAMAPGTNIGAAHPVALGGGEMDKEMKKKVENDAAAYIRTLAERHGRNVEWAEDAVRKSISATEQEALKLNVVDLVVEDLRGLLTAVDGREVTTANGKTVLRTKDAPVVTVEMGGRLRVLNALSDPNVAYILMLLGIYGLIFELSNPGAILPGVVGGISLILAFYAFQTLPINYAGLLLIILGIILFIAEIKVMSYGLLTVGGVVAWILGSLMLVKGDAPFLRISWAVILPSAVATLLFFVMVVGVAVKSQRRRPLTGVEGLVGRVATAKTDLLPRGKVLLQGETWDAVSSDEIREGEEAEVTGVDGLRLLVRKHRR